MATSPVPRGRARLGLHLFVGGLTLLLCLAGERGAERVATWIGVALFYPAAYAFIANLVCRVRNRPVCYRMARDDDALTPFSDFGSTAVLGFFALIVALGLIVPEARLAIGE